MATVGTLPAYSQNFNTSYFDIGRRLSASRANNHNSMLPYAQPVSNAFELKSPSFWDSANWYSSRLAHSKSCEEDWSLLWQWGTIAEGPSGYELYGFTDHLPSALIPTKGASYKNGLWAQWKLYLRQITGYHLIVWPDNRKVMIFGRLTS